MNVLLVEADYKNAYPPIGLMKISTYHKSIGDVVYFTKGMNEKEIAYDRIYVTTLFTFYYDKTLKTINYYEKKYSCEIYIGGIASTILYDKFRNEIPPRVHILKGLLTSSNMLGYHDDVNVDELCMDYSILDQIDYVYKTNEGYISYTSRGCVNKCPFCAVPTLEPNFCITNNLWNQIENSKLLYGEKKDLLLLDNNILALNVNELRAIVDIIKQIGFYNGSRFKKEYAFETIKRKIQNLEGLIGFEQKINQLKLELVSAVETRYALCADSLDDKLNIINENWESIVAEFQKHDKRKGSLRYIDFNQGMDARLLTEEKMKILSELPIKPFRLAFDHVSLIDQYEKSVRLAAKYGVKYFSNYLLYNYEDDYNDLYVRMQFNVELGNELDVNIHSFPMRYAPIHLTHRNIVGPKWKRFYLTNFRRILIPTRGVIGVSVSYFYNAFGNSADEFKEILSMPYDLLIHRNFFQDNGITDQWRNEFHLMSDLEKEKLIDELSNSNFNYDHSIMRYYKIRYEKEDTWRYLL